VVAAAALRRYTVESLLNRSLCGNLFCQQAPVRSLVDNCCVKYNPSPTSVPFSAPISRIIDHFLENSSEDTYMLQETECTPVWCLPKTISSP
jgi:hypothetical protein